MKYIISIFVLLLSIVKPEVHAEEGVKVNLENVVILDVRTPAEYKEGHVKGAVNIDFHDLNFMNDIMKLDKKKEYKIYCRSGNRSGQALKKMMSAGFKKVENIGGLNQAVKNLNLQCEGESCS